MTDRVRAKTLGVAGSRLWLDQNIEDDDTFGEVDWRDLYDDCCRWHDDRGLPRPSRQAVGQTLATRYVKRNTTVRRVYWQGLRLKPRPSAEDRTNRPYGPHAPAPATATGSQGGEPCRG